MPGVIIKKNTFIQAGTVVSKSTKINSYIYGNPQKERKNFKKKIKSIINKKNKNFIF